MVVWGVVWFGLSFGLVLVLVESQIKEKIQGGWLQSNASWRFSLVRSGNAQVVSANANGTLKKWMAVKAERDKAIHGWELSVGTVKYPCE